MTQQELWAAIQQAAAAGVMFSHAKDCNAWHRAEGSSMKRMNKDSAPCTCRHGVLVRAGLLRAEPFSGPLLYNHSLAGAAAEMSLNDAMRSALAAQSMLLHAHECAAWQGDPDGWRTIDEHSEPCDCYVGALERAGLAA